MTPTIGVKYEIGPERSVSVAIVEAVSSTEHCSPRSLPPLNETIDPDALDKLFESWSESTARRSGHVLFEYSTCLVSVADQESITIELRHESTDTA